MYKMSILDVEQLPRGLLTTVSKLSFFKKEFRKFNCDVSSVSPNGVVRCRIPTSGLLNLSSLTYTAKVAIATADSYVPPLGCFIDSLRINADGQVLDEISSYNLLFRAMLSTSCSDAHARTRYTMGCLEAKPSFVIVDDVLSTSTDATAEAAAVISAGSAAALSGVVVQRALPVLIASGTSKWANEIDFLGFLGSLDSVMLDQWPSLTIEFNMAGNNILASATGTWSITDQYFTACVFNYSAALESFQALFERNPGQITPITYSFDRWVVQQIAGQAATQNNLQFNVSSSNLRKVLYTYRPNGFNTQAVLGTGMEVSNYFKYAGVDTGVFTSSLLYVNSRQYNQYPVSLIYKEGTTDDDPSGYCSLLTNLGVESDNQFDNLINSFNQYKTQKFIHAYSFDWPNTSASEISGLNTQGNSNLELQVKSSAAMAAGGQWVIFSQCSALVHVSPGRVLSIEY